MNKIITLWIVCLAFFAGLPALADVDKGLEAFANGDYAGALAEFRPLAEQGNADAQFYVGGMYNKGHGVLQDYRRAVKWFELSAQQGHLRAQYQLAGMYLSEDEFTQDYERGVQWARLAAEEGLADAQALLGLAYVDGRGVKTDYIRGHMWLNIAKANGIGERTMGVKSLIEEDMTRAQIEKALDLAHECIENNYKGC